MNDGLKKKIMDKKWENLEKEGLTRPESMEENKERAEDAHVPDSVR